MTTLVQISVRFHVSNTELDGSNKKQSCYGLKLSRHINSYAFSSGKLSSFCEHRFTPSAARVNLSFVGLRRGEYGNLTEERCKRRGRKVAVKFNQGFGFNGNGGGGGGGGRDDGQTARLFGNLALAIGLTYLSFTGQLGWVLDAVVSVWLLAVLLPIVGLGAFLWWAGRDIIQSSCPNCGNDFQVFKSSLNDDVQLCPFCSQPFSVVGNEFVRDSVKFSNQTTTFGQVFNEPSRSKKGKVSSSVVVDVEAEIKDAD